MDEQGGVSIFSVENFLSSSAENFRMRTLYCVINFGYRKNLCFRGLCHDFLSKFFCPTVSKHLVKESFYAVFQNFSCSEKVHG